MTSTLKTEKIQFRGDNSDVILLGSEKMGIGPNPVLHQRLNIQSSAEAGIQLQNNTSGTTNSTDGGRVSYYEDDLNFTNYEAAGKHLFYVGGSTKAMEIDAQGQVIQPLIPAAQASKNVSGQIQNISGSSTYVIGSLNSSYTNSHSVNNGSYFDSSTSKFTVPSGATTARYFCLLQVLIGITRPGSGVNWGTVQIRKNGAGANNTPFEAYREATNGMGTSTYVYDTMTVGGVITLAATDYLEPMFGGSAGVDILIHSGTYTSFSVIKIG